MSTPYQPFPITEFKTGINTYLQPWIRPADAFEPLVNAYVNRGTINKRAGSSVFGAQLPVANPVMGIMRYINEATGAISLIVASTVNLYSYKVSSNTFIAVASPPTFTGNITNFFNWTNWQASDGATSYLWMVNGKDPVTNVTTQAGPPPFVASQPTIAIDGAGTTITTALDVKVYKQRLLLIKPTLSTGGPQNQSIYWSAVQDPTTWNPAGGEVVGAGFLAAPTGDIIIGTEFLRDVLVVFFTNSTWIFRYTGSDSQPFRWDKINNSKSSAAPYATQDYDERCTSIGSSGLIACDGVNVQRYDIPIIDYYETAIQEDYYSQCFSQRYDNLNQTWMLYVSTSTPFAPYNSVAPGSDSALVYNFLENTFATYTFSTPMTCLGLFYNVAGEAWEDLVQTWESTDAAWNSFAYQSTAPILLGGDVNGYVYKLDDETQVLDAVEAGTASIVPDIVTTRWNPVIKQGQKTQFGYIDIYYVTSSVDPSNPVAVTLNFYLDNSEAVALTKTLTLDGPSSSTTQTIATGNGGASYLGTLSPGGYIVPLSLEVAVTTSAGLENFDDNGAGVLVGNLGDSGTINYNTGAWTITLVGGRTVPSPNLFVANYQYNSPTSNAFKRIYLNLIGQFVQMEIDPNIDSYIQFNGFVIWARAAGRLTSP